MTNKVVRPSPIIRSLYSTYLIDLLSDRISIKTVGARLDQLSCSGEETTLLDALSCPTHV